ncbi:MAG: V-type ATP synthase subunit D [Desulfobacterales bacterium]|nr:V-type ATP synthase subunit D [Desulfobacterales bacterium]MDJ0914153.1 V-type ATP synthase subunit D [Desulfobacterales bacterium]
MAKLALSKSGLQKQRDDMRLYERVLPSLDLKRMQISGELKRARQQLFEAEVEVQKLYDRVAEQLPMLANRRIDVSGLVQVESFRIEEENLVGVKLPKLVEVKCQVSKYSMLAKPHWVDMLVDQLKQMVEQRTKVQVAAERVRILEQAVRRITQRVNLFDKILIPTARKNIQKIQIYLADAERAAVVRSKITKRMRKPVNAVY